MWKRAEEKQGWGIEVQLSALDKLRLSDLVDFHAEMLLNKQLPLCVWSSVEMSKLEREIWECLEYRWF